MLDVRWPIGILFATLGLLLAGYGLASAGNTEQYARSLAVNVNLWWGLVMLCLGWFSCWPHGRAGKLCQETGRAARRRRRPRRGSAGWGSREIPGS
jgi:hypothetical protein